MKTIRKRRLFLDLDGVIVDFDGYMKKHNLTAEQVKRKPGAYLEMDAIAGAIEAVRALINSGYDVWIATKPPTGVSHAYADKAAWVFKHLPELTHKLIITHHKGMLGDEYDLICDDRPEKAFCNEFKGELVAFVNGYHWQEALPYLLNKTIEIKEF